MRKEKCGFENNWISFWFGWRLKFIYSLCGYFDPRHELSIGFIFFTINISLPWKSKFTDECDPPEYGFDFHHNKLWVHYGGDGNLGKTGNKYWTFTMPWDWDWVRTSALKANGSWEHETRANKKDFYEEKWDSILWKEKHPYNYKLNSGEVQNRNALISVYEREWRWHWFKWLPFLNRINKTIEIEFDAEVGERSGSWKGGTLGCSYTIKPGETPAQCLKRMEGERKFR